MLNIRLDLKKREKFLFSLGYLERTVKKYNGEFLVKINSRKQGEYCCFYHRPRFIKGYRCISPTLPVRASEKFKDMCEGNTEEIMQECRRTLADNGERVERRRFPDYFFYEIVGDNIHLIFKISFKKDICNKTYLYFDKI